MSEPVPLKLRFKGARDYLHGTDLHDAICSMLASAGFSDVRDIDLTFHKIARTGVDARLVERGTGSPLPKDADAVFQFASAGKKYAVVLNSNGSVISERVPYPEEEITAQCQFTLEDRSMKVSPPRQFSNIEVVVAANKSLLQRLFPEEPGKWYFARLKLAKSLWDTRTENLSLRLEANLNFVITRSAVYSEGEPVGQIFFSLVR